MTHCDLFFFLVSSLDAPQFAFSLRQCRSLSPIYRLYRSAHSYNSSMELRRVNYFHDQHQRHLIIWYDFIFLLAQAQSAIISTKTNSTMLQKMKRAGQPSSGVCNFDLVRLSIFVKYRGAETIQEVYSSPAPTKICQKRKKTPKNRLA